MKNTLNRRYATLGNNLDEKDISGSTTIVIEITGALPLFYMSDSIVSNTNINTTTNAVISNDLVKNVLVGDNTTSGDKDRFVYITKTASDISGMYVSLYYDKKFEDIIVIPDLDSIVDGLSANNEYYVTGYRVGSTCGDTSIEYMGGISNDVSSVFKLPEVVGQISTNQLTVVLPGIAGIGSNRRVRKDVGGLVIYDNRNTPIGMLSLGSPVDLFGVDAKLPILHVYQATPIYYGIKYAGIKNTSKLYIPLDF